MARCRAWYSDGSLMFDSDTAVGGCVLDVVVLTGSTQTKNYPDFTGRTVTAIPQYGYSANTPTISYGSGYPSVTFPAETPGIPSAWMLLVE